MGIQHKQTELQTSAWISSAAKLEAKNLLVTSEFSASSTTLGMGSGQNSSGTKAFRTLLINVGPKVGHT